MRPDTRLQDGPVLATASLAFALLLVLVTAIVWWNTPSLRVGVDGSRAEIHMELLGEYPSDIRSIEIESEGLSSPIWKVVADGGLFQAHSIQVHVGDNSGDIHPFSGTTRQILPPANSPFRLDASSAYRVTVCPASLLGLCQSASFVLAPR